VDDPWIVWRRHSRTSIIGALIFHRGISRDCVFWKVNYDATLKDSVCYCEFHLCPGHWATDSRLVIPAAQAESSHNRPEAACAESLIP
jgi:hypothetical protein